MARHTRPQGPGVKLPRLCFATAGPGAFNLFSGLAVAMSDSYPVLAAYARACGADGHRVETLEEFEDAFRTALASGRPTIIDASITRWAAPHYSPSPGRPRGRPWPVC
ncbi:thiamine pyrophosphate-dependent enzyme [Actinomadura sp. 6N118]|uniref:thiamine pyrophosphate-dependent enzyme n=1 Tax=Actinomadura sp. 6N118 TaxID=3375151 RepID=UPI0037888BD9